ncbi:MAG: hypothetical protein HOP19_18555 [Acidobacteria bacterium]|nr:hypothetical protein [Acidobacteriota bacterium]
MKASIEKYPSIVGRETHMISNVVLQMRWNLLRFTLALVLCAIVFCLKVVFSQGGVEAQKQSSATASRSSPIRLILSVNKNRVRRGSTFKLTVYLENWSDKPIYVGNQLPGNNATSSLHYIEVETLNSSSAAVFIGSAVVGTQWEKGATPEQKLAQAYTLIKPGGVHGIFESGQMLLPQGGYILTAKYHEVEAAHWSEKELNALPYPVLTQKLISNTVKVTVIK